MWALVCLRVSRSTSQFPYLYDMIPEVPYLDYLGCCEKLQVVCQDTHLLARFVPRASCMCQIMEVRSGLRTHKDTEQLIQSIAELPYLYGVPIAQCVIDAVLEQPVSDRSLMYASCSNVQAYAKKAATAIPDGFSVVFAESGMITSCILRELHAQNKINLATWASKAGNAIRAFTDALAGGDHEFATVIENHANDATKAVMYYIREQDTSSFRKASHRTACSVAVLILSIASWPSRNMTYLMPLLRQIFEMMNDGMLCDEKLPRVATLYICECISSLLSRSILARRHELYDSIITLMVGCKIPFVWMNEMPADRCLLDKILPKKDALCDEIREGNLIICSTCVVVDTTEQISAGTMRELVRRNILSAQTGATLDTR